MILRQVLGRLYAPKMVKFLSAGLLNTVFGYSIYAAFLFIGLTYLAALFIATIAGVIFNYFSFGRLVFNVDGGWLVFGKFVLAYFIIYGTNAIFLKILIEILLLNSYIGQIIFIPINVLLSWILMSKWVYKK